MEGVEPPPDSPKLPVLPLHHTPLSRGRRPWWSAAPLDRWPGLGRGGPGGGLLVGVAGAVHGGDVTLSGSLGTTLI